MQKWRKWVLPTKIGILLGISGIIITIVISIYQIYTSSLSSPNLELGLLDEDKINWSFNDSKIINKTPRDEINIEAINPKTFFDCTGIEPENDKLVLNVVSKFVIINRGDKPAKNVWACIYFDNKYFVKSFIMGSDCWNSGYDSLKNISIYTFKGGNDFVINSKSQMPTYGILATKFLPWANTYRFKYLIGADGVTTKEGFLTYHISTTNISPEYALNAKGLALMNYIDNKESIDLFKEAIKYSPKNASFYFNIGNAYYYTKKYNEAITYFERSAQLDPSNNIILDNIGECYGIIKKYDKALLALDKALSINPNDFIAKHNRMKVLKDMHNAN